MSTLGERIRKLRKEQKLTLEELAGDTLTKGMLSLIENNKANPSMESLTYIAKRLQVEVSELMEEINKDELQNVLSKAETLYYTDLDHLTDELDQFLKLVEPYIPKLTQGYEAARILDMYSRVLRFQKRAGWQSPLKKAALLYEQMNVLEHRARISIFLSIIHMENSDYQKALDVLYEEQTALKARNYYWSPLVQLDFNYMEAVLLFAVGNYNEALTLMEESLQFSKEQQVFYKMDHLLRLAVSYAIMSNDQEKLDDYLTKTQLYAKLTDDDNTWKFIQYIEVQLLISQEKEYNKALSLLERYKDMYELGDFYSIYYHLEKGKALFGLKKYNDAILEFQKIQLPEYLNHPFDLISFCAVDSYLALCYLQIGKREKALAHATLAYENVSTLPPLPNRQFVIDTFEDIKKSGEQ